MRSMKRILVPVLILFIVSVAAYAAGEPEEQTANLTYVNW